MNRNVSWILVGISLVLILIIQYLIHVPATFVPYLAIATLLLSFFVISKASDYTIYSINDYAKKTKLPHFLVGFVILSIVTVLPDLFTGFFSFKSGHSDIILGDVLTATLVDLFLLIGLVAVIVKKLPVHLEELKGSTLWLIFGLAFLPLLCFIDKRLSLPEGILLLVTFSVYLMYIARKEVQASHIIKSLAFRTIWKDILIFGLNIGTIILGARYAVASSEALAQGFGISTFIMGFIFIALGNSLPEIVFTIKMARMGVTNMGLGNSFGSILVNLLVVWGASALVGTIIIPTFFIYFYLALLGAMIGVILLVQRNRFLNRTHGLILLGTYLLFTLVIILLT